MLWGNTDNDANSVSWGPSLVNLPANSANRTALFGNSTLSALVTNQKVGIFGVDSTEVGVSNGSLISVYISNPGSGYFANATVTLSGNATANAAANSLGKISVVNITSSGSGYTQIPTITIAAPAAQSFNANTAVASNGFITIVSNKYQVGDKVKYLVAAGNTSIAELSSGSDYYIAASNSSGVYLTTTPGGTAMTLTKGLTEAGHSFTGETATAVGTISGGKNGVTHSGWVLRKEGTGGRAGRVQYETLVAMGSLTGDAEDTVMKDS